MRHACVSKSTDAHELRVRTSTNVWTRMEAVTKSAQTALADFRADVMLDTSFTLRMAPLNSIFQV